MPLVEFDLTPLLQLAELPLPLAMWRLFLMGGWIPTVIIVWWGLKEYWIVTRQNKYAETTRPVLLAINLPKLHEQTPKAVENIFSHIQGAKSSITRKEHLWQGKYHPVFSFEIISIEGKIQFLVWCWGKYRDLMESLVFAQYPDAEISEVEDYTENVPHVWPNKTHEMFATEFALKRPEVYPIRTHISFEDKISGEFKDPLSGLLEVMGRALPGEQMWWQVCVQLKDSQGWRDAGLKLVKKLIGAPGTKKTPGIMGQLGALPGAVLEEATKAVLGGVEAPKKVQKDEPPSLMLYLSPGERLVLEGVENKISKIGHNCKVRYVYISPKGKLRSSEAVAYVRGAMQQFSTLDMNSFVFADRTVTRRDYGFQMNSFWYYASLTFYKTVNERMMLNYLGYKYRSTWRGHLPFTLNIEELATIWHFPVEQVKAPLIKKTESKRAEPPYGLPTMSSVRKK